MKQEPLLQMGISSLCMAGFPVSDRRSTGLRRTFFALKTASLWTIGTSFKMKQPRSNPRARLRCSAARFQHICEPVTLAGSARRDQPSIPLGSFPLDWRGRGSFERSPPHAASPPGSSRRAGGYSPVLRLTADEMSLPYCPVLKSSPSGTRLYCRGGHFGSGSAPALSGTPQGRFPPARLLHPGRRASLAPLSRLRGLMGVARGHPVRERAPENA